MGRRRKITDPVVTHRKWGAKSEVRPDVKAFAKKCKEIEFEFKEPKVQFNPYLSDPSGHKGAKTYCVNLTNTKNGVTMNFYLTVAEEVGEPTKEIALQALINEAYTVLYHGSSEESFAEALGIPYESSNEKWHVGFLLRVARRQSSTLGELLGGRYKDVFPSEKPKKNKKKEEGFW